MAKREAALSGGDGGIVSIATCKDLGHKRIELSVVASKAKQSTSKKSPNSLSVIASVHSDSGLCHCGRDIVFPRKAYKPDDSALPKRAHIECANFVPKCPLFFAIS